ncbi:hypothetical protein NX801_26440 [Streptomyces sp. LP05-1]|uniref:Uncharacterized protein n=1 Tax=Streptomyces pyxinae TaxID=2970734 RepID=A0ABT2CNV9_9ACTN|nr:hypothetical protein [Streptomyces sp. LP05-1]MCS0639119.1 hypothetical protein [Streptomyces sp. LP05-1]
MSPQPEPLIPSQAPPMRTLAELRDALHRHGFPGDPAAFERELADADLDEPDRIQEIVQAYRHRVLLHIDPEAMAALRRSAEDIDGELRRRMAGKALPRVRRRLGVLIEPAEERGGTWGPSDEGETAPSEPVSPCGPGGSR